MKKLLHHSADTDKRKPPSSRTELRSQGRQTRARAQLAAPTRTNRFPKRLDSPRPPPLMLYATLLAGPALLLSPLRTPAPVLRAPVLRMQNNPPSGWGIVPEYWANPSVAGGSAAIDSASPLDTTPKFEEIAGAAAAAGSAAVAEGFEEGTCDPYDPKSAEYCSPTVEESKFISRRTLKLGVLFTLWYALNTAYNIGNKLVLTALPIPWTSATIELFFGLPYIGTLWLLGLRKKPKLSLDNIKTLAPSAFFLSATHVGGVISFGAGAISFTHVLKATEPVWTVLLSAVFFREFLPWQARSLRRSPRELPRSPRRP